MISKPTATWLLALGAFLVPGSTIAQAAPCPGSGGWLNGSNLNFTTACTLENAHVRGNVMMMNGTLTIVSSTIDGNVAQVGPGDLIITEGDNGRPSRISGNVNESGDGDLRVVGSIVTVNVNESGAGGLLVRRSTVGTFRNFGNVAENGDGSVFIDQGSWVHGNVAEDDSGGLFVRSRSVVGSHMFPGNLAESKSGNLIVRDSSHVAGNVAEDDAGDVGVRTNSYVGQNVIQGGTGRCVSDGSARIKGNTSC